MSTATTPAAPLAELLDARAVAALLGVSARHVVRLADRDAMPRPVRVGACVRWRRSDLDTWIAAGCPSAPRRRTASTS